MKVLDNLRLGLKLPLMLVSVSIIALGVSGGLSYELGSASLKKAADAQMKQVMAVRGRSLEDWAKNAVLGVQATAAEPGIQMLLEASRDGMSVGDIPRLSAIAQRLKLSDFILIDTNGNVVDSAAGHFAKGSGVLRGSGGRELATAVQTALATDDKGLIASASTTDRNGNFVIYLVKPIVSSGRLVGVVAGQLPARDMPPSLLVPMPMADTEQAYVFEEDFSLMAVARPAAVQNEIPREIVQMALNGEVGVQGITRANGDPVFLAYEPLNLFGHRYALVTEQPQASVNAPVVLLARNILMLNGFLLLLIGGLSWMLARSVARPLEHLTSSIDRVAKRHLDDDPGDLTRKDEIGDITRALASLRSELIAGAAVQREASFQGTAFQISSAAMMTVGADFVITYVNQAMIDFFTKHMEDFRQVPGMVPVEQLVGTHMDMFHVVPDRVRATLCDPKNLPFHTETAIGSGRFGLDVNAILGGEGEVLGYVVEWRDVTELRLNRALLRAIGDTQLLFEADPSGKILKANENLFTALGVDESHLLSANLRDIIIKADGDENYWDRILKNEFIVGNIHLKGANATIIADGTITAVFDQSKRLLRIVMIATDVTAAQVSLATERERNARISAEQQAMVEELRIGINALSTGDLTTSIANEFPEKYEQLRIDFNAAVHNLEMAMQVVIDNASTIDRESRDINTAAEDLSIRTEKQAATLEETAAALDELTVSVSSASAVVMEANHVAMRARESAENSGLIVEQAVSAMGQIEESSRKISRIIGVIDDIAFQTNLLALNAGVEAARAGEAGRGFAVVASEVRALAQRSSDAAREIDRLITTSSDHVRRGVDLVGETGTALEKILLSVNDIAARMSEIAASSHEQASGLSEINIAVNQLDQVTQHNAAMFEQTTAASHALSRGAQELSTAAMQFNTGTTVAGNPAEATTKSVTERKSVVVAQGTPPKSKVTDEDDWQDF